MPLNQSLEKPRTDVFLSTRGGLGPIAPMMRVGPIQVLFEGAASDTLLLYETCFSAAGPISLSG